MTDPFERERLAAGAALSRRGLLRLALLGGGAAALSACGWDGGPLKPLLRGVSRVNDLVGEKVLLSGSRLARQYPLSARTPEDAYPAYMRTRPHAALPVPELAANGRSRSAGWCASRCASPAPCSRRCRG